MFKYFPSLTEGLIVVAIVLLFSIIGTMERLTPEQEAILEAWRHGEELVVAGR